MKRESEETLYRWLANPRAMPNFRLSDSEIRAIIAYLKQQAGLRLDDFSAYTYTGSHAATANAVTSGRVDAGALQDTLAQELARRELVRILALSESYPSSGIIAAPHVPQQTAESVRGALLRLAPTGADSSALYDWERIEMPLERESIRRQKRDMQVVMTADKPCRSE